MDLKGNISSIYELVERDNIFEELPVDLVVNAINSVPLHERLGIKKELLSESELKTFEDESKKAIKCFRDEKKSLRISRKPEETSFESLLLSDDQFRLEKSIDISGVCEKEETNRYETIFLKHLYNCDENDPLIPALINNTDFNISIESEEVPESVGETDKPFNPAALLNDISCGKWDDMLTSFQTYKQYSSSESEEETSTEVLRYSNEFKNTLNTASKPSKFQFFEAIKEDSLKVNGPEDFNPASWVSSDTESEGEQAKVLTPEEPIIHQKKPTDLESSKKEISSAGQNIMSKSAKKKLNKNKRFAKTHESIGDKISPPNHAVFTMQSWPDHHQAGLQSTSLDQGKKMGRSRPTKNVKKFDDSGNRDMYDLTNYKASQAAIKRYGRKPLSGENNTNKPGASIEKSYHETRNVTSPKDSSNNLVSSKVEEVGATKNITNKPGASIEKSNHKTRNVTSPKDSSNNLVSSKVGEVGATKNITNKPGASIEKSNHKTRNVTSPKDSSNNLVSSKAGEVGATKKIADDSDSDSSDEDWASLAEKNLSVVDRILKKKK